MRKNVVRIKATALLDIEMAIIYTIENNDIIIQRIIAAAMIF